MNNTIIQRLTAIVTHKKIGMFLIGILVISILGISIRGTVGNPSSKELNESRWKDEGPFELSPDRGRFALTYSILEDHSLSFSSSIAQFAMPDVAEHDGKYVSLFAPTVSYLVMPGYLIGKFLGASQVGSFAIIAVFALFNVLLIRSIAIKLGANSIAATLASVLFLFASPAFSYAVTLYQHHISTFIILLSLYCLLKWKNFWSLCLIWFLCGVSISVDNPNVFMMLPIGIAALLQTVSFRSDKKRITMELKTLGLVAMTVALIPMGLFLYFNNQSYGSPFQLAGTVASAHIAPSSTVQDVADVLTQKETDTNATSSSQITPSHKKSALGFFKTRNMPRGMFEHILSPDRGMLFFTPIMLIGSFGLVILYRKRPNYASLLLAIMGMNILLYSMWGDPFGGWAFGSRYLIPTYAICAILLAFVLTKWRHNLWILLILLVVSLYSVGVNTVGALTSNRNPPKVEVLALEALTGRRERYSFDRNIEMLLANRSKSFVYNLVMYRYLIAWQFAGALIGILAVVIVSQYAALYFLSDTQSKQKPKKKR